MPILSSLSIACARAFGFTSGFFFNAPVPSLFLDFASTTTLDSRITFTRATNGTFFNSSGVLQTASSGVARFDHRLESSVWVNKGLLIEEQRANLFQRSEEFDNAYWDTKTGATISANVISAPDGTTTAEALVENSATSQHFVAKTTFSVTGNTTYTVSVFAKKATRDFLRIAFSNVNSYVGSTPYGFFNLDSGAVGTLGSNVSASIQDCGNGWFRCFLTATTVASPGSSGASFGAAQTGTSGVYAGSNGATGIYLWGAQLEVGAFSTSYIKTTTASVTRNADQASMTGTDFTSWYNATEGSTFWQGDIVGSSAVAKRAFEISDGTTDERILVTAEDGSGNGFLAFVNDNSVAQAGLQTPNPSTPRTPFQTYKHSFAYKVNDFAASLDGLAVQTDTSGTIPTVNTLSIGWSIANTVLQLNGHIAEFAYWPTRLPNNALKFLSANGYDNDGLSLILNFDQTTVLDPRITFTRATNGTYFDSAGVLQTASSGVARFDHRLESSVWVNKGLFIEEQRTNLNIYSEEFDNAAWTKTNTTVTANDETAPDGNVTADAIVENTTNSSHQVAYNATIGITGNNKYTASVFLKKGTRDWGIVAMSIFGNFVNNPRAWFDLNNGVVGTLDTGADAATIQDCGNGWYRCTVTATSVASPTAASGVIVGCSSGDNVVTYAGTNGAKALYAWGAQYELGAFPTSYIKTTTVSVTRNADEASMTGTDFSDWYNQTEGTVFFQAQYNGITASPRFWEIFDGTGLERMALFNPSTASPAYAFRNVVVDNNAAQAVIDSSFAATTNQTYKTAAVYKVNDFALGIDGSLIGTDTSGTIPTVDRINFARDFVGTGNFLNGHIAKFYYWNTRKPDSFLQSITR